MSYFKNLLFVLFIFNFNISAFAQYHIKVKGIADSVCYLAYYHGNRQYVVDTSYINKNGVFIFNGRENLDPGMYIFAGHNKNKYFDFIVNNKQKLYFKTDTSDILGNLKVKKSLENKVFFQYLNFIKSKQRLINSRKNDEDKKLLSSKIKNEVYNYTTDIIEKYPNLLVSEYLKLTLPLKLPDSLTDSKSKQKYYKQHFFDNINFTDKRILNTPFFDKKIKKYFSDYLVQNPDTIIKNIDVLINRAGDCLDVKHYLIWYFTLTYERSKIMGLDAVFVHLARKYYENDSSDWIYPKLRENIINKAKILKPLLIGKFAPNLLMLDTNNQVRALYGVKAKYTILFFWDSECGFCQDEIKKMKSFYNNYKDVYNFEIFGVSTDTSLFKMKNAIKKYNINWINVNAYESLTSDFHKLYDVYSTPEIYLLNGEKKIIAKKIFTDDLIKFIKFYDSKK
ncbi:MAG: redoxin domain-containing protein [Bacteroidales bacterium]|nr:redoxin domain-containing protein [Bacteroidales bacterium]